MAELSKEKYEELFKDKEEKALERAWLNRDFEISHYWKRAAYFWTFIAVAFAGYFTLLGSSNYDKIKERFPQLELVVICLGFIFSLAWLLANFGSKKWQKNWEKHINELEDSITGPIYKVVYNKRSYSVSKINIRVNIVVILIWVLLGGKFLNSEFQIGFTNIDYFTSLCVGVTGLLALDMLFWGGKSSSSYFKKREPFFYDYKSKNHMKDKIKIFASKKTDAMEGWGWICPILITENGYYRVKNLLNNKKVTCYLRIIDDNYVADYNDSKRTSNIQKNDKCIVLNEYYRKILGVNSGGNLYDMEIKKAKWYTEYISFEFAHPNPYVRQSGRLTILSFCLGIIALVFTIYSLM